MSVVATRMASARWQVALLCVLAGSVACSSDDDAPVGDAAPDVGKRDALVVDSGSRSEDALAEAKTDVAAPWDASSDVLAERIDVLGDGSTDAVDGTSDVSLGTADSITSVEAGDVVLDAAVAQDAEVSLDSPAAVDSHETSILLDAEQDITGDTSPVSIDAHDGAVLPDVMLDVSVVPDVATDTHEAAIQSDAVDASDAQDGRDTASMCAVDCVREGASAFCSGARISWTCNAESSVLRQAACELMLSQSALRYCCTGEVPPCP